MNPLRILSISHRVPYPLFDGGTIGIYNLVKGFSNLGCKVDLLCLNAIKHGVSIDEAKSELEKYCTFKSVDINTSIRPLPALLNLFSNRSYNVERFESEEFRNLIRDQLKNHAYDIIQIEGTFPALYGEMISDLVECPIVLRQHNVEYQIWERLAKDSSNPIKSWYLRLLARRLKRFEKAIMPIYDALVPVSPDDGHLFKEMGWAGPTIVHSSGIDLSFWDKNYTSNFNKLYHLGSLEWHANREAVDWFLEDIWPAIAESDHELEFYIAGRGMPAEWKNRKVERAHFVGEVPNAVEFASDKGIQIVPLRSGSGIRIKILEAMAAKKINISTSIGVQGIEGENGHHFLVADKPSEFVEHLSKLKADEHLRTEIISKAYKLVKDVYSTEGVSTKILDFYHSLIDQKSRK